GSHLVDVNPLHPAHRHHGGEHLLEQSRGFGHEPVGLRHLVLVGLRQGIAHVVDAAAGLVFHRRPDDAVFDVLAHALAPSLSIWSYSFCLRLSRLRFITNWLIVVHVQSLSMTEMITFSATTSVSACGNEVQIEVYMCRNLS